MSALALALTLACGIGVDDARNILFEALPPKSAPLCDGGTDAERIACLIDARYARDAKAKQVARELYRRTGSVAGVLPAQDFDGAYRGKLKLVPHLPVDAERKHLEWFTDAMVDVDAFFADVKTHAKGDVRFRWRDLDVRFFRSVKRRTPSAVASGWTVAYNVSGSLFTTTARVRETLFHEIFHLNDFDHGASSGQGRVWSQKALTKIYDGIVAKCGKDTKCLAPYAPDSIIVRQKGGTYYAFMPDNGVVEYAADLAKRWYVEHRALWKGEKVAQPFKCRAPENAAAWRLLVEEFFGGVDRTPACT